MFQEALFAVGVSHCAWSPPRLFDKTASYISQSLFAVMADW